MSNLRKTQTPITDAALRYVDDHGQNQTYGQLTRVTAISRKLERDRAALIAALEVIPRAANASDMVSIARAALARVQS